MLPSAFFSCATCGVELTEFLSQMPEDELRFDVETPAVPRGNFIQVAFSWTYRDFVTGRKSGHTYGSADGDLVAFEANDYLLGIAEVRHLVVANARYGCCGLQPRAELNATCPNGHAIGTIHSDCWAASVCRLAHTHVTQVVA